MSLVIPNLTKEIINIKKSLGDMPLRCGISLSYRFFRISERNIIYKMESHTKVYIMLKRKSEDQSIVHT